MLVGGLPGTGKTTLAQGLADRLGWAMLRSDEVRKGAPRAWTPRSQPPPPRSRGSTPRPSLPRSTAPARRAELALGWGDSVVLDATWLDPDQRDAAHRLAMRCHAHLHELRCDLAVDEATDRIRVRAAAGGDASDATPEVLAALAQHPHRGPGHTASTPPARPSRQSPTRSASYGRTLHATEPRTDPQGSGTPAGQVRVARWTFHRPAQAETDGARTTGTQAN